MTYPALAQDLPIEGVLTILPREGVLMTYPERGYLGDSGSHTWVCSSRDPGRRAAVGIVEEQWGMLDICKYK